MVHILFNMRTKLKIAVRILVIILSINFLVFGIAIGSMSIYLNLSYDVLESCKPEPLIASIFRYIWWITMLPILVLDSFYPRLTRGIGPWAWLLISLFYSSPYISLYGSFSENISLQDVCITTREHTINEPLFVDYCLPFIFPPPWKPCLL